MFISVKWCGALGFWRFWCSANVLQPYEGVLQKVIQQLMPEQMRVDMFRQFRYPCVARDNAPTAEIYSRL